MKKIVWLFGLGLGMATYAQDLPIPQQLDSVFIATKSTESRSDIGKVLVTIGPDQLSERPVSSVAELINEVSGIEINGSRSNQGQNLGYFIRGGRNRQVVILLDGVAQNDPSFISNDFDLRLLSTTSIEKIEIIKGASSILYGSGAATAVISITSKQPSKKEVSATVNSALGTNRATGDNDYAAEFIQNSADLRGTLGRFNYSLGLGQRYAAGLSAVAAPPNTPNFEEDLFNQYNLNARLGFQISERLQISRFVSLHRFTAQFDNFDYTDAENESFSDQLRTGGNLNWKFKKGEVVVNDSHAWLDRENESSFPTKFDSQASAFDTFGRYQITDELSLVGGVNANFSRFNSFTIPFGGTDFQEDVSDEVARFELIDPYMSVQYTSSFGLNLSGGVRLNTHSNYGNHWVYHVNPSYVISLGESQLKLMGSYGTAFITPSLFQLYDPLYGNETLTPEENTSIEGGVEFSNGQGVRLSAVYFSREENNFVEFVTVDPDLFLFQYQNINSEFMASGLEFEVAAPLGKKISFSGNYTFTMPDDHFALRVPEHKAFAALRYKPFGKTNIILTYAYTGDREDVFFDPVTFESQTVTLDAFSLFNLQLRQQISDAVGLYVEISNVFDEEYEEVYRFQTRGRNLLAGVQLNL